MPAHEKNGWSMKSFAVAVTKASQTGMALFIIGFVCTEVLLIAAPFGGMIQYTIPYYSLLLFALSNLLSVGIAMVAYNFRQRNRFKRGSSESNIFRGPVHTQGKGDTERNRTK